MVSIGLRSATSAGYGRQVYENNGLIDRIDTSGVYLTDTRENVYLYLKEYITDSHVHVFGIL